MVTFRLQLTQALILATGISSVGRMQLERVQLLLRDRKPLFGGKQFWRLLERMAREFVKQVKDRGGVFLWRNTRLSFVIRGTRPRRLAFTGEKWKHLTTAKLTVSRNKHDLKRFFSDLDLFFGMKTVHSVQSFIFVLKTYAECSITCLSNLSNFISPVYHQSYQSNMWLWWMSCSLNDENLIFRDKKGETRGGRVLKLFNWITISPSHKGTAAFIVCSRMTSCSLKQRAAKMLLLGHPAVWKTKYLIKKRFQEGKIFHPPNPCVVRPEEVLILKTIGNRKGDCAWSCSRWQTQPEKISKSQRTNQCHLLRTLNWFVLCNLLIFSGCVCHLEQLHAQSPFLFPIVFSINLIPFFDICSVLLAVLSPRLFGYVLLYLGRCTVATVAVCGFGSWSLVFHCGLPRQISPLPPTPSQTAVCYPMGESIRPSSFHNPTLSANKHLLQTYRSSLSAAAQTVQVSVEPRLSTALKDRSVVP